jgi:hypothetical protein
MELEITFANVAQEAFYKATERNQCFSGGFNNGKTYVGCLKALTLLTTFSNYRMSLSRQVRADLMKSTYQTFFKLCPRELIERNNEQEGFSIFKNRSVAYWIHLDKAESSTLRGFELNSNLTDQAEEMQEETFDILDSRIGRWDHAEIPQHLLNIVPNWPANPKTGKLLAPSYNMLLCNPDTQFHFIFRKFHPNSLERRENYFYVEGAWDPGLGSYEAYQEAQRHDSEWVDKFIKGEWGKSSAQIHRLPSASLLDYTPELIDRIKRKGNLFRILDHGDFSPTACLWCAALDGNYIFYREYYIPNQIISYHRQWIHNLSAGESYSGNYADPAIFHKDTQKKGGFWSVADEYLTKDIPSPPLYWIKADNNEYATRNRINELLTEYDNSKHPISGEVGRSPKIYFIKKSTDYPNGCFHVIKEIQSQRRKLIGYIEGKAYYSDEREDGVPDHAYDCIRYMVAMHGSSLTEPRRPVKPNTFNWYRLMKRRNQQLFPPVPTIK